MSIFRYLISHNRSDYEHDGYRKGEHGSRYRAGPQGHFATEKRRCPHCQYPHEEDARYCNSCGKPLISKSEHCQQSLSPLAAFCEKCGQPVQKTPS